MLIGTFGIVADVFSLLGPSTATEEKQAELQATVERTSEGASDQLSEINDRVQDILTGSGGDGGATDGDPRARIVELTGDWSVQGLVDAIYERNTDVLDLYLKSGMSAATLHQNASAILYGFQGTMNNDPVALLQTFQANGYKLDDELTDGRILDSISEGLPLRFETEVASENYTGGYEGGSFAGSLLLWIVSRASYVGVTDQDEDAISYLIEQGADCTVPLSYPAFNRDVLSGTAPFDQLYPTIKGCAT